MRNLKYRGITRKLLHCSLFTAHCSLLLLLACQDPYGSRDTPIPAGKGSVTLVVDGADARTISPDPDTVNKTIVAYTIRFLAPGTSTILETFERSPVNLSEPFCLASGTYDIQVIAYKDEPPTQAVARGEVKGIEVVEGTNVTREVSLDFIFTASGKGTFRWEITVPDDLSSASMKITPVDEATGTGEETISFTGTPAFTGSRALNTGYYKITFELNKTGTQKIIFREFLHVFDNVESFFSKEFTDSHFNNINYTVTFVFDNGTMPLQVDYTHGEKAAEHAAGAKPPLVGLYTGTPPANSTFTGWYYGDTKWDFNDPVTGDMTLTAHWTTPGLVDTTIVPANDIAATVPYINENTGAYTLLMSANATISSAISLTSGAALTIKGQSGPVTITNSGGFTVTGSAALGIGNNITFSGNGAINIDSGASLALSDNAKITTINLNATSAGNSSVTIIPGWNGSVTSLNLRGDASDINAVIGFWYNQNSPKTVLKGEVLIPATVERFTLGDFISSDGNIKPITEANPPGGYIISADEADIGKLVVNDSVVP